MKITVKTLKTSPPLNLNEEFNKFQISEQQRQSSQIIGPFPTLKSSHVTAQLPGNIA